MDYATAQSNGQLESLKADMQRIVQEALVGTGLAVEATVENLRPGSVLMTVKTVVPASSNGQPKVPESQLSDAVVRTWNADASVTAQYGSVEGVGPVVEEGSKGSSNKGAIIGGVVGGVGGALVLVGVAVAIYMMVVRRRNTTPSKKYENDAHATGSSTDWVAGPTSSKV